MDVTDDEEFPAAKDRTLVGSALATSADVDWLVCTTADAPEAATVDEVVCAMDGVLEAAAVDELVCATAGLLDELGVGGASMRMNAAKLTMSDE